MSAEEKRAELARRYQNGGMSYADYEREMNALAIAEFAPSVPERTEPMPDASGPEQAAAEPGAQHTLTADETVEQATFEENVQNEG